MKRHVLHDGFFLFELVETQDGPREIFHVGQSACVLFYEPANRRLVLVRQPRVAMITDENPTGHITEVVAGLMDDGLDVRPLMAKEAREEAGIRIPPERIELLNEGHPLALAPGATDERTYLGYAEITSDEMDPGEGERGAPGEGERVVRTYLSLDEIEGYICDDLRLFALLLNFRLRLLAQ